MSSETTAFRGHLRRGVLVIGVLVAAVAAHLLSCHLTNAEQPYHTGTAASTVVGEATTRSGHSHQGAECGQDEGSATELICRATQRDLTNSTQLVLTVALAVLAVFSNAALRSAGLVVRRLGFRSAAPPAALCSGRDLLQAVSIAVI